jgi:hypothetical protein
VPAAAAGLVEKLREALGTPPIAEVEPHHGDLPSLAQVPSATFAGVRIQTNARRPGRVTGIDA